MIDRRLIFIYIYFSSTKKMLKTVHVLFSEYLSLINCLTKMIEIS